MVGNLSIINNNGMDWTSSDLIYVITWTEINCGMQYVDKLAYPLRLGLVSTFVKWKSLKNWNIFLSPFQK